MAAAACTIYVHSLPQETVIPLIRTEINALPLLRRLQFHLQTKDAVVLATFPETANSLPAHYSIAYVDRSRAPETECWVYNNVAQRSKDADGHAEADKLLLKESRRQLLSLLAHIHRLPLPQSYPKNEDSALLLVGALHRNLLTLLKNEEVRNEDGKKVISGNGASAEFNPDLPQEDNVASQNGSHVHGSQEKNKPAAKEVVKDHTVPYAKFIFLPSNVKIDGTHQPTDGNEGLPTNLQWTKIRREELKLVMSRTDIPRKERTLLLLPGIGIRVQEKDEQTGIAAGTLIAWAFLGADGSLTSLHVEPEYRGKGLAKTLTRRVFALLVPGLADDKSTPGTEKETLVLEDPTKGFRGVAEGQTYTHSDVARDNIPSTRVAAGLGGVDSWDEFWAWVNLEAVQVALIEDQEESP